jgi:hypothetical protein
VGKLRGDHDADSGAVEELMTVAQAMAKGVHIKF